MIWYGDIPPPPPPPWRKEAFRFFYVYWGGGGGGGGQTVEWDSWVNKMHKTDHWLLMDYAMLKCSIVPVLVIRCAHWCGFLYFNRHILLNYVLNWLPKCSLQLNRVWCFIWYVFIYIYINIHLFTFDFTFYQIVLQLHFSFYCILICRCHKEICFVFTYWVYVINCVEYGRTSSKTASGWWITLAKIIGISLLVGDKFKVVKLGIIMIMFSMVFNIAVRFLWMWVCKLWILKILSAWDIHPLRLSILFPRAHNLFKINVNALIFHERFSTIFIYM